MYRERSSSLPGAVVWTRTVPAGGATLRILPDGCLDLIWSDGRLLVAGPDTTAHVVAGRPGTRYVGLRFAPGTGAAVLDVPAYALRDSRVPLADVWPATLARRLADELAGSGRPGTAIESFAAGRVGRADPAVAAIADRLRGGATVAATADAVGLSERQLHRRCLDAFGYGPKMLARVLRLDRALRLARADTPFATVAALAGYADQAHLARDVKALAGVTLGSLTN